MSPFLLVQPQPASNLFHLSTENETVTVEHFVTGEPQEVIRPRLAITKYPIADMVHVSTIEEAEDHYINSAPVMPRYHDTVTTFALNAQASVQASHNRRGIGWVVLLHPTMFERVKYTPEGKTQFIDADERMGRWHKVATENYRGLEVWLSDHLSPDEIITVYRARDNVIDGMVVGQTEEGFALGPAATYMEKGLMHRRDTRVHRG